MNSPPSANSWIGRYVGDNQRYRLEQRLGGGGMGEVFLADDTRVGQQVALKLLKDTLVASQEMRKRFEREVAVSAALYSDHIVKINDYGITPEGFPFYVMEYLRGKNLRQLLMREKQLSVERTAHIMAQICQGLELAHQGVILQRDGVKNTEPIKVVHRDLKPDNIFLVPTDLGEWVKILDFGVAKIRSESSQQAHITNITTTFLGTFRYSSPEQIQNDRNLDARADIYSLGIILYEMLSATDPFGLSIKSRQISETSWLFAHASKAPTPIREQPGCQDLSPQLEAVVLKCLQKNPSDRFSTVAELNQALQAAVRPLIANPGVQNQQIIPQPQILQSLGSHDETIAKPLSPSPSPGSTYETIPKQLNPLPQAKDDGTIMQTKPRANQPVANSLEGTIMQPKPGVNQPVANSLEGTIMQPKPGTNQPAPNLLDGTLMQPRTPANQPPVGNSLDGTIMQVRTSGNQPPVGNSLDGTIMQVRTSGNQPSTTEPEQKSKIPAKVLLVFAVILAIALGFGLGVSNYLSSHSSTSPHKNLQKTN